MPGAGLLVHPAIVTTTTAASKKAVTLLNWAAIAGYYTRAVSIDDVRLRENREPLVRRTLLSAIRENGLLMTVRRAALTNQATLFVSVMGRW